LRIADLGMRIVEFQISFPVVFSCFQSEIRNPKSEILFHGSACKQNEQTTSFEHTET
jgi:hypothetical protein